MKHEAHIVTTESTLKNGDFVITDCALSIEAAQVEQVWDDMATGAKLTMPTRTALFCQACLLALLLSSKEPGQRRVYAVTEKRREQEHMEST